jgi:hypothetical protein
MIPMTPGEVIDRWTILSKKYSVDASFNGDLVVFMGEALALQKIAPSPEIFLDHVKTLFDTNEKIWELEADIRSGAIPDSELEEIGRRAIKIRDLNKVRVQAKGEIDKMFGFTPDKKINHRSE